MRFLVGWRKWESISEGSDNLGRGLLQDQQSLASVELLMILIQ